MSWQWNTIIGVWVLAVVGVVLTALFAAPGRYLDGISLTLALSTLSTLVIQLLTRHVEGYVKRATWSIAGIVVILALATAVLALAGR